ncbi:MAG: shikimate kinase [Burkholderiaceae bacterium]|jgi:shikimate kinase|nr:shikimate kinase [Aquabacterium sp.]NUP84718.1 shikimate kinase [Burkholderiaceae bacterium]
MPGCGKSTVGRHLARQLGWAYTDSDTEIEREIGMPIRAFFESRGEAAFRDLEESAIEQITRRRGLVIATGGGAILRETNRRALASRTWVIYLRTSPEELFRRLRHDTQRPLLQVDDPLRRLRELFRERDPLYRTTARYVIDIGRPTVHALVNMVLMQLELAGLIDPALVPATVGREPTDRASGT